MGALAHKITSYKSKCLKEGQSFPPSTVGNNRLLFHPSYCLRYLPLHLVNAATMSARQMWGGLAIPLPLKFSEA